MNNIPPYKIATWMLDTIDDALEYCGLPHEGMFEEVSYIVIVVIVALLIGVVVRTTVLFIIKKIPRLAHSKSMSAQEGKVVLVKCADIIPPLVFISLIPFVFSHDSKFLELIEKVTTIYIVYVTVIAVNKFFNYIWKRYDEHDNIHNHPWQGLLQVSKGIAWIVGGIIVISMLIGKSPVTLLTGLGAFAAVLLLVFKDSILGMISGIQLSQNDMLRVGDWIVVPNTPANGIVVEVTLTVVKVQNWDNTIAMLPPYTLVSTSFRNWRGMYEVGTRLISRSLNIAVDSVTSADGDMLTRLKKMPLLTDFIAVKQKQAAEKKVENTNNSENVVNGTIDTNLGLLRAYITLYLQHHPFISKSSTILVSELQTTAQGVPIQIFCYVTDTDWDAFESVQSEIFEHLTAILPNFSLVPFQYPSGTDVSKLDIGQT